jgi:PRTRC genetic system ThiF family protein
MPFVLPERFYTAPIKVALVGCGGTGSQVLPRLVQLHRSLLALGHPGGLLVTVFDDDRVAGHNCCRQNYVESDVGRFKTDVSVYRVNVAHGLAWESRPERFGRNGGAWPGDYDLVVGAVDTKASRRSLADYVEQRREPTLWIDMGNESVSGQMVAGCSCKGLGKKFSDPHRLPLVTELFPEIIDGPDDNAPSCSAVASLNRQGVATNLMAATLGFSWLAQVIRDGQINWCGAFFNLEQGRVSPISADPAAWAQMGLDAAQPARKRRARAEISRKAA